ncbi:MAG: hypothetical protein H6620_05860 [Halobacteriovoraceae bacterium]|nr:hypothetical protein [Halobacteriovoraceae bacterium]
MKMIVLLSLFLSVSSFAQLNTIIVKPLIFALPESTSPSICQNTEISKEFDWTEITFSELDSDQPAFDKTFDLLNYTFNLKMNAYILDGPHYELDGFLYDDFGDLVTRGGTIIHELDNFQDIYFMGNDYFDFDVSGTTCTLRVYAYIASEE